MNDYEISKLKKELQRKHQLLKEEQEDRQYTEKQLVLVQAERDKYHSELLIARQQIENIDKIIAENVRSMKAKLQQENSDSINQLKQLKEKLRGEQFLNQKLVEQNRNKDATIAELSARLREMSKKYKDPSLLVNTKQISEQAMITHNQFYKLTEKYNKLSKDMQNIMAQNKILRKLHGVPDNFGFDLEEIKIAEKQELQDYKAQCRKLQTQIQQLQAQRTQLRYRLRQYNTLYSNKGERYKDMTQQQLELLDLYAINLKEGKNELPQIDKSQKQMQRQILKLRAQVQVLQNKSPMQMMQFPGNNQGNNQNNDRLTNDQLKKFQEQIKTTLEPFVQDIKKLSQANLSNIIQNVQNIQNIQNGNQDYGMQNVQGSNFKGPIPLPIAHNDWSKIKEGYSFIYSSKIPVDMKDLDSDVSFDVVKARYEVAALQLQNIQSLKLLKQKQKIQNQLSKQLFQLKQKYKKCLKVQDQLFVRYFKDKQSVNDKIKKLQIEKHALNNQKQQLEAKLDIVSNSYNDMAKKGDIQKRLQQYTSRLAISEAQVLKMQRKYQIINEQQVKLRQTYTNLQAKTIQAEYSLKQKLISAKNNQKELTVLVSQVLDSVKDSVSSDVHNTLLSRMQLMNDKSSNMISKQTELRLKVQKLESIERDSGTKNQIIQNLRQESLQILLQLQIVRNRLRTVDIDYRTFCDTFDRLISYINQNNISLMSYFKKFDRDGSGQLNKKQFQGALNALGFKMTSIQLDLLYNQFDLDGSNSVTYKQFIRKMRRGGVISRSKQQQGVLKLFKAIQHSKLSIRKAFQIIDVDGSNSISKSQMQSALSKIGINTTAQTVQHLFKMCDFDGDNSISCQQLQRLYKQMVRQSEVLEKQIYSEDIDWKLAFVLKLQEVSLRFKSSLAQTFKKLDDDGNAVLTITQLSEFIKKAEMQIDRSSLQELFNFLDRQKDGRIQYGQFLKILAQAKSEQKRIERIKYIKQRTSQLKTQSMIEIASKKSIDVQSNKTSELQKLKIRISALDTKQTNLVKKYEKISKQLATRQQQIIELKKNLQIQEKQKMKNHDKLCQQQLARINLQSFVKKGLSEQDSAILRKQVNQLRIQNLQLITNFELYKGLYEGLVDKNKGQELRVGKIQAERNKYYDIVKQLQSASDLKAQVGKLNIQIQYSKRNQQIINTKYDRVIQDLRKIDEQNRKLGHISIQKQKQIINTHVFFQNKTNLQQRTIDDLALKIIPTVTMDKMEQYIVKLREISNSKSSLQQENRMLRQKNFNLQVRNDYIQNQKLHIEQLQRKLRNQYTDDSSKTIIDLTKKLSDYKMSQLRAKRQLGLLKQKQQYYLRINNTHTDNIKELQTQLSSWEVKFNEREEFWRKRLADQMKLMEQFQQEAKRAKQQQIAAMSYFSQKNIQQQGVNKKYQKLNSNNMNNISQFIKPTNQAMIHQNDDQYTQKLLERINGLEQELMMKQKQIHHFKASIKDLVPEANISKLMDMGSQMNISTNSFVLQTQLTGSQIKNNARRFLNNQKQIQVYYKEQNARITQAAQQSIDTLQRIIDDKNQQLKKKQRIIQDLKKQFMQSKQQDCKEIQKLNEELRDLRSKKQMGNLNQIMSKTTNKNFYPSKSDSKLQEYQKLIDGKDIQIRNLQQKYDKLLISKSSAQNQKTASKNAANNDKLKQKMQQLNFEREIQKKKFIQKQKQLQQQISNLKKIVNTKTKKIQQLNSALLDIKSDIINEKNTLSQSQVENNLEQFVGNMTKGTSKNDAQMEQYLQTALLKIKTLQGQNRDLRQQLGRAKDVMGKTAQRFGK